MARGELYVKTRRRWPRRLLWTVLILTVFGGLSLWLLSNLGTWLVVQDPLTPAPVAVVLSGGMPDRAREAAEIYRNNGVTEVWITRPGDPTGELHNLGIDYLSEAFYNQRVLIQLGVPAESTRVLETTIYDTEDEVRLIAKTARDEGIHNVIIVTSKAHTRRVHAIWRKLVGNDPALTVRYARNDPFDARHWWRHTGDALQVVREVLGLANTWAGFPIKHGDT